MQMNPEEMLDYWQKLLGLTDWKVVLKTDCFSSEMKLQDSAGENEWKESIKVSVIRTLKEEEYGERILPFDLEKTLVHELLHLKFCLLDDSGNELQDRYIHQLIDDLARAFVAAKRFQLGNTEITEHANGEEENV